MQEMSCCFCISPIGPGRERNREGKKGVVLLFFVFSCVCGCACLWVLFHVQRTSVQSSVICRPVRSLRLLLPLRFFHLVVSSSFLCSCHACYFFFSCVSPFCLSVCLTLSSRRSSCVCEPPLRFFLSPFLRSEFLHGRESFVRVSGVRRVR